MSTLPREKVVKEVTVKVVTVLLFFLYSIQYFNNRLFFIYSFFFTFIALLGCLIYIIITLFLFAVINSQYCKWICSRN